MNNLVRSTMDRCSLLVEKDIVIYINKLLCVDGNVDPQDVYLSSNEGMLSVYVDDMDYPVLAINLAEGRLEFTDIADLIRSTYKLITGRPLQVVPLELDSTGDDLSEMEY